MLHCCSYLQTVFLLIYSGKDYQYHLKCIFHPKNKLLWSLFIYNVQPSQGCKATRRQFTLTAISPEVQGAHLTNLRSRSHLVVLDQYWRFVIVSSLFANTFVILKICENNVLCLLLDQYFVSFALSYSSLLSRFPMWFSFQLCFFFSECF